MLRTLALQRFRIVRFPDDWSRWIIALLIAALAVQSARLLWVMVTPVAPLGDWRPAVPHVLGPAGQAAVFATVNPFDRAGPSGPVATLPNDLKLFGVRAAAGGLSGGAIIQLPDGQQVSVSVGESVMPDVVLVAVGFDFAEVSRGGARQRLFLDPDKAPESIAAGSAPAATAPAAAAPLDGESLRGAVSLTARTQGSAVTGILVAPGANAADFQRTGLRAGDVIVTVNGAAIRSAQDLAQLQQGLAAGGTLTLEVERERQRIPVTLNIASRP